MNLGTTWADYQGGFGSMSATELSELNKALTMGSAINNPGAAAGEGFPLRVESLENTLANLTFRERHVKLWRALPKRPAFNTVEEYNQLLSYGNRSGGGWVSETELPSESDSTYRRNYATVKLMGVTRRVSLVSGLVRPAHGNILANETISGTMELLKDVEKNLFFGDSSLDPIEWDGFEAQITAGAPAENIIDMRGEPLTEEVLQDAALIIQDAPNYGTGTHLFLNPKHLADLTKISFPRMRTEMYGGSGDGYLGGAVKGFTSIAGDVAFEPNVFLNETPGVGAASLDVRAPAAPASVTSAVTTGVTGSKFIASDIGSYNYSVVAGNRYGKSAATALASAASVAAAGSRVRLTITPTDGKATYFEVYRTLKNGAAATVKRIKRIAANGASAVTFDDLNLDLPGTAPAFFFQLDNDNMHFAQLAPMVKIPLATVDPTYRWMQLLIGVPIMRSPGRNVLFKNVGRAAGSLASPAVTL